MVGAELLRLAGGPGRGWYPRHRQPRPASVEHLDHLATAHSPMSAPGPWEPRGDCRKPLTLPPNLTPKFFHRSPREALRRVTSLLIRKDEASAPPVPPHNSSIQRQRQESPSTTHILAKFTSCHDVLGKTSQHTYQPCYQLVAKLKDMYLKRLAEAGPV
ncbi:hypothetical protein J6590_047804 [Homalodisca vitripennis]|nr:hypothetical protein J6590_047804 [Homalodisca vitripennis]